MLSPVIAVVTNIDADHLENYDGDFGQVKKAFADFLHRLPFYGLAVLCIDDEEVAELANDTSRRMLTYGIASSDADVRATNVRQLGFEMHFDLHLPGMDGSLPVTLNLPGEHNVLNALAAAAVGWQLGVEVEAIATALRHFEGVGRRFHRRGEIDARQGQGACWSTTTAIIRASSPRCSPPRAAAGRNAAWWSLSSRIATAVRATCSTISPTCSPKRTCWC